MEVDDVSHENIPMNADDEEYFDVESNNIQAEDIAAEQLPAIQRSEPWHAQFSSSWLPYITRDIARQQRQVNFRKIINCYSNFKSVLFSQGPQRMFSDSYISGMNSKRRKVLQSKKPTTNVQSLVASGVREVIAATKKAASSSSSSQRVAPNEDIVTAISNDPAVLNAFRDEIKANASQRMKNDPDFDAEKHPTVSKAFK